MLTVAGARGLFSGDPGSALLTKYTEEARLLCFLPGSGGTLQHRTV